MRNFEGRPRSIRVRLIRSQRVADLESKKRPVAEQPQNVSVVVSRGGGSADEPSSPTMFASVTGVVFSDLRGHAYVDVVEAEAIELFQGAKAPSHMMPHRPSYEWANKARSCEPARSKRERRDVRRQRALMQPTRGQL